MDEINIKLLKRKEVSHLSKDIVNHPHLIGVGMSREGNGQQVDKEA